MAALARVERTDFLSPMCIGEVAHVSAEITYTSKHSVEVQVHVMSENILTGNVCMQQRCPWGRHSGCGFWLILTLSVMTSLHSRLLLWAVTSASSLCRWEAGARA